jgi:multidrug efflux pump subunit AcrB
LALGRPRTAVLLALVVLVAGGWAALVGLPVEWSPRVELPALLVEAAWPGASTLAVEREVTRPIESAIEELQGVAKIESETREGRARLRVEISAERRPEYVLAELSDRLAALRSSLPPRVQPRLAEEVPRDLENQQDFMTLQLVGDLSPLALRALADDEVAPRLRSLPGAASVLVEGGEENELLLTLDQGALERQRKGSEEVRASLREATQGRSLGFLRDGRASHLLWWPAAETSGELLDLPLAQGARRLPLSELATARQGPAPLRSISRVDGQAVVTLVLERSAGSHLLEVASRVGRQLETLRAALPPGVRLLVATDRSRDLRLELRRLAENSALGFAGVILLLTIFLRGARPMLLVLFATAVSLAAGLSLLAAAGLTLNILTLAGVGLLVGILVDNATVVVESLAGLRPRAADAGVEAWSQSAARCLQQVFVPLLGATATTCAIFLPMLYLSGELRALFASFAWVAALTLTFSLLVATLGVPVWAILLWRRQPATQGMRRAAFERVLTRPYALALRWPRLVLALLLLVVGLPMPLLPERMEAGEDGWPSATEERLAGWYNASLGSDAGRLLRRRIDPWLGGLTRLFLEQVRWGHSWVFERRAELFVTLRLPPGSDIRSADELMRGFERLALAEPLVQKTVVRISERSASLTVQFPEDAALEGRPVQLRERLVAQALTLAGVEVRIAGLLPTGFSSGLGRVNGFPVEIYGSRWETCGEVAARFAEDLRRDPRVAAIDLEASVRNEPPPLETLQLRWSGEAFTRSGVDSRQLAERLRARLLSHQPDFMVALDGEARLPLRVTTQDADALEMATLLQASLFPERPFRLGELATLERKREPPVIERQDQQYRRLVRVEFQGPTDAAVDFLERTIAAQKPPVGYFLRLPSEGLGGDELRRQLGRVLLLATFLVFLVMAAVLESWSLAFLCLAALPVGWIGIVPAFVWSGENFAEGAFLGVILIVGITVSNTILLGYRYRDLRRARPGQPPTQMALLALRQRLRPIWATATTSLAGLVPLLVLAKPGDFWLGLALAVIGGLLASTALAPALWIAWLALRRR